MRHHDKATMDQCKACSDLDMRNTVPKPACYELRKCARMRSYYRHYEAQKFKQRNVAALKRLKTTECRLCGSKDELETHHIEPRIGRDDRNSAYNMMTLCFTCHRRVETYQRLARTLLEKERVAGPLLPPRKDDKIKPCLNTHKNS